MKIYQKLMKLLAIMLFSALLLGVVFVTVGSSRPNTAPDPAFSTTGTVGVRPAGPTSASEVNTFNPAPPDGPVRLVFIHHSCGDNWLRDSDGELRQALNANNYYVLDVGSGGWGPPDEDVGSGTIGDHTDIGHWYNWFAGPHRDTYLSALYTTDNNADTNSGVTDPGGENEIIMFKSCFPNSLLQGDPDEPPTVGENPLRGRPWDAQVGGEYVHTVGNAKGIYNDLLEYFRTRQDKLFVVITAPPHLCCSSLVANARALNNWLVNDWLDDYPYHNVAVFDFFNVLTTNGGDSDTNDYGWSTGNHHRVVTATTPITIEHVTDGDDDGSPDTLEYPTEGGTNPHPSPAGNQKATGEFVPLLNVYYNRWVDSLDWISVTAVNEVADITPGETATYTLLLTGSAGFTAPVTLTLQGAPSGTTISFDPNPVAPPGTSQLCITTTASTVAGTYVMTVTGASGQVIDTTSLTLTINPALSLTVRPVVRTALPGEAATYTLSVTAGNGFTAPVTLGLQGAPSDAVASFAPNPVIPPGTSQLHITTTTSTAAGIYAMTAAGTAGVLADTASLFLIVTSATPSFTLNISPTTRIARPNQTVSYTAVVTGVNGFSQPVTLTVLGLPTGVGASWSVNPVTPGNSSILTLSIPSSPPFGDHPLQVVGTAETQTVAESVTLIIDYPFKSYLPIILK